MDRQQVQAYLDRYRAVEAIEIEQNRAASVEWRWQQLNHLYRLALGMGLQLEADQDDEHLVWRRWAALKRIR